MAPGIPTPPPVRAIIATLERLKKLYEATGFSSAQTKVEHFSASVISGGRKERRGWSEVSSWGPDRAQMQVCNCCDQDDADFIYAVITAFPQIVAEIERNSTP